MRALRLESVGSPLKLTDVPEPTLRPGGAIVRVTHAPVLSYMKRAIAGGLGYLMPTPFTPGPNGIGVVEAVADDVIGLQPGMLVSFDSMISTHSHHSTPESILIGLTGLTPGSGRLQALWRDGLFAERAVLPAECLTPLTGLGGVDQARLALLGFLAVPYGGLLRGELRPGQTLVVNGATGSLGSLAVLLGLALGASRVVAVGRDRASLSKLRGLDERRVVPVVLAGDIAADAGAVGEAAGGADLVFDLMGGSKTAEPTVACIRALRPHGTAVLMGGVPADLALPYMDVMLKQITIRGNFMHPRSAPGALARMIAAGTLDLAQIAVQTFPIDDFEAALDQAAGSKALSYCILTP